MIYVLSKNGIPEKAFTALKSACIESNIDYQTAYRRIGRGKRVVNGIYRIEPIELVKVKGRGSDIIWAKRFSE